MELFYAVVGEVGAVLFLVNQGFNLISNTKSTWGKNAEDEQESEKTSKKNFRKNRKKG